MTSFPSVCTPNEPRTRQTDTVIVATWILFWIVLWLQLRPAVMPTPFEVLEALPDLWLTRGLGPALLASLSVNLECLALSTLIALPLAYASRIPAVRPLAVGISKLRVLSPGVFFVIFLFMTDSLEQVKLGMLVAGEVFFLLTSMLSIVQAIPEGAFDDARTLRMNEWQATWYVVVRGTLPDALSAIRDNQAIGWSMLIMVEKIVESAGGAGVLIANTQKYHDYPAVGAIALCVLLIGISLDYALVRLRLAVCPYLSKES